VSGVGGLGFGFGWWELISGWTEGDKLSDDEIQLIIREVDMDGDGKINFEGTYLSGSCYGDTEPCAVTRIYKGDFSLWIARCV
jgi:hypothetical protein